MSKTGLDTFTIEIVKDAMVAIGDEMFNAMIRTSMSPIIYETTDFAVGLTDKAGQLLAQGNGVAGFLATLDTAVASLLENRPEPDDIRPGDVFITNDPYQGGGTHLSDVVIILPIFVAEELIGFTVNKAHWTEVGGAEPGSVSTNANEIYQEGLRFNFLKLYDEGKINASLVQLIRDNVRLPDSTIGDMHAGVAAARVGAARLEELVSRYGRINVLGAMDSLLEYGERMVAEDLRKLPDGIYKAEDVLESDGCGNGPFKVVASVTINDGKVIMDFSGTDPQAAGPINTTYTGLATACRTVFKAITNSEIPANGGCFRNLEVICPPGSLLSAEKPAPVSLYYEALLAAVDVVWKALAPIVPQRLPAGTQRSVNATFVSGNHADTGEFYVMGEPLVGGWGASEGLDGDSGQFCPLNGETFNIPVELAEARYGFLIDQYAFHNEPGGAGKYRGGKGTLLDYRVTAPEAFLTFATSRFDTRPWGIDGGGEGSHNYVEILRKNGEVERHHMVTALRLEQDEVIRLHTATGGGFGDPRERDRESVQADIKNGFISAEEARAIYGLEA